jgi:hypothetical protein
MKDAKRAPRMDKDEIRQRVLDRLNHYENLNTLERFAMFMGKAQILEAGLKGLLVRRYGYNDHDKLDKMTLGTVKNELKSRGLRGDFISLLEAVVQYRNHIAHELLANIALLRTIAGNDAERLALPQLDKGIYELEQIMFLHDWCEEHDAWG